MRPPRTCPLVSRIEALLPQDRRAKLTVMGGLDGTTEDIVQSDIVGHGFRIVSSAMRFQHTEVDRSPWPEPDGSAKLLPVHHFLPIRSQYFTET